MKRAYTIILPLRNGGDYLKECVQSVLSQTYADFELAVLENNSSDGSLEWLQGLNDARIKIYAAETDLSIEQNWARATTIPRHEWMTFIGHDDRLLPDCLQVIDDLIEGQPNASLYQTQFHFIDSSGARLRACATFPPHETAAELLRGFLCNERESYSGFVMRSAEYDAFGGIPSYKKLLWADHALWIGLTRRAGKVAAPEECFELRVHPESTAGAADWEAYADAMRSYIAFLKTLAREDAALNEIVSRHAPHYFLGMCRHKYLVALVHATKRGQRLDARVLRELTETLAAISPELSRQIAATPNLRLRQLLNNSALLREIYRTFIRVRHGRSAIKVL